MADAGRRQPAVNEPFHPLPMNTPFLTPSFKCTVPVRAHGEAKVSEGIP